MDRILVAGTEGALYLLHMKVRVLECGFRMKVDKSLTCLWIGIAGWCYRCRARIRVIMMWQESYSQSRQMGSKEDIQCRHDGRRLVLMRMLLVKPVAKMGAS